MREIPRNYSKVVALQYRLMARWMGKLNLCENKIIEQHEAYSIYSDIEQTTKIEHFV